MATIAIANLNIDQVQDEFTALQQRILDLNTKHEGFVQQISAAESEIAAANGKYEAACRALATGEDADTVAAQTALERLSHKLRGLQVLDSEAVAPLAELSQRSRELARRIEQIQEQRAVDALIAKQENTARALQNARKAHDEAQSNHHAAVAELSNYRTKLEQRDMRRQRGLE